MADARKRRRTRLRIVALAIGCALLAGPASRRADAADPILPQLTVVVVPPRPDLPRPTGRIVVSLDGRPLLSLALVRGLDPLTAITPLVSATLSVLGRQVTVSYSGDSNYEASDGIAITLPTRRLVTIATRQRDSAPPEIEILSPADGARLPRGSRVDFRYTCRDPGTRSAVVMCAGPVASGEPVDTATAGTRSFTVSAADAVGNATTRTVSYAVVAAPAPTGGDQSSPPPPATGGRAAPSSATGPPSPRAAQPPIAKATTPATAAQPPITRPTTPATRTRTRTRATPRDVTPRHGGSARTAARTAGASAPHAASRDRSRLAAYDLRSEPVKAVGLMVSAFTLMQLGMAGRGLALAGVRRAAGARRGASRTAPPGTEAVAGRQEAQADAPEFEFDYEGVDVEFLEAGVGVVAIGDRSRTWGWPGTRTLDRLASRIPTRIARRSPLLAGVLADGTYLRAILGSTSLFGPLAGLALGAAGIHSTHGEATAPDAALTIAIAVLGVLDAGAGLAAVLTFLLGVTAIDGISSNAELRLLLGLAALWCVVPLLAGAARPLRRAPARGLEASWDRAADFVIASLIGAWAAQKIVLALPGLAGVRLPIAEHADATALSVLAALVVRLGLETVAAHLYPRRLNVTEPNDLAEPGPTQRHAASALRTAIFVFFAGVVVGNGWQLWAGAALFAIPQVLAIHERRLPNSARLHHALPKGLVELVVMLLVASAAGALLIDVMDERSESFLADSFVLLALPGFLLSLLSLVGRDGEEPRIGWAKRLAGVGVLGTGVLLALGIVGV